ncbi:hypothetical protein AB0D38_45510, partial [Streptomyces sp. NPDC048279]
RRDDGGSLLSSSRQKKRPQEQVLALVVEMQQGFRRIVALPSALRRCTVAGAALRDGELRLRFAPDPDLWPR